MILEKRFDFGDVLIDTQRCIIFIDRGEGKEILQLCKENEAERKQLFEWVQNNPDINTDDASQLAWQYGLCDCDNADAHHSRYGQPFDILKIQSPDQVDEVKLELLDTGRSYELRKVRGMGTFLVNQQKLVYPIGGEKNWMEWSKEKGWQKKQGMDEIDRYFVEKVLANKPERFFQ